MIEIMFIFLIGALGSLVFNSYPRRAGMWGNAFAFVGSLLATLYGASILATGDTVAFSLASSFPQLAFSIQIDPMSALFLVIVGAISTVASLYAFGYVKHYYKTHSLGSLGFFYNLFIASMLLVVTAHHILFFLVAWELMSLTSYFLVIYESDREESRKAGILYFIMTHAGTAFIVLAFLLIYRVTGSFDFSAIQTGLANASPLTQSLIFLCALIGFGAKAGMIPLHIWLPAAHPAAPSHISAIMSGVMIKTGIYMIVRIAFGFFTAVPLWWGILILVLGAVSALMGVLYALTEHDIKRLLAYHSIENIGIILLGVGAGLVFYSVGALELAYLSIAAALFHTANHAVFKALLFLGAGAVIGATHTRDMEEYGGLARVMPYTAPLFLIGAMAISALPPLNGFMSEWLTFQSLFAGVAAFPLGIKIIFILSVASLAITGGLAAACFVKVFGITFLARPRSDVVRHAHDPSRVELFAMEILAALTLILGIASAPIINLLISVAGRIHEIPYGYVEATVISMPGVFSALVVALAVVAIITGFVSRKQRVHRDITWDCGTEMQPRMEITGMSFARSLTIVFRRVLRPEKHVVKEFGDAAHGYFPKSTFVAIEAHDVHNRYIYEPVRALVVRVSEQIKRIQTGNINVYVLYMFVTLIGLLIALSLS